ncbi:MAG: DUF3299 domain-containing protein [Opitutaceae bacterium]
MKSSHLLLAASVVLGLVTGMRSADAPVLAVPANATKVAPPEKDDQGYLKLGFDQLASYSFTPPPFDASAGPDRKPATGEEQIPANVKAWNGKKAVLVGYMMPVKMEKGLVTEFLLMRNTVACCYGGVPNLNEWVIVKMKKGVPPMMDLPVSFYGELKVGAIFENGYLNGLYELVGERMGQVQG